MTHDLSLFDRSQESGQTRLAQNNLLHRGVLFAAASFVFAVVTALTSSPAQAQLVPGCLPLDIVCNMGDPTQGFDDGVNDVSGSVNNGSRTDNIGGASWLDDEAASYLCGNDLVTCSLSVDPGRRRSETDIQSDSTCRDGGLDGEINGRRVYMCGQGGSFRRGWIETANITETHFHPVF